MAVNSSEAYLAELAQRSFLKLWTLSNPHHAPGKETTDLLVAFGDDLIVFSDKASAFKVDNISLGWKRWRQRTIDKSVQQLGGAAGTLAKAETSIFLDGRATQPLPFDLSEPASRRLHLVAVARPDHDPTVLPPGWRPLLYADHGLEVGPFEVGPAYADGHFVHVFDGQSLELLLANLNTAPDFLSYLKSRESILRRSRIVFAEPDLLALATNAWIGGRGFTVEIPNADSRSVTIVPSGLWAEYARSERAARTRKLNAASEVIDRLIEHFHEEHEAGRNTHLPAPTYAAHERAMRILAAESRFGRRLIASALEDILKEAETHTFWAATVPSKDVPGVRYVWLTYPRVPDRTPIEEIEDVLLHHLWQHLLVARLTFPADLVVGIAVPNRDAKSISHIMCVLDGRKWGRDEQEKAEYFRAQGIFSNLEEVQQLHRP